MHVIQRFNSNVYFGRWSAACFSQIARSSTRVALAITPRDLVACQPLCFIANANYLASKQCFYLMIQKIHTTFLHLSTLTTRFHFVMQVMSCIYLSGYIITTNVFKWHSKPRPHFTNNIGNYLQNGQIK